MQLVKTLLGLRPDPAAPPVPFTPGVPFGKMIVLGVLPSPVKVWLLRRSGARIGRNVSIGLFSWIESPEIELADGSRIGPFSFVKCVRRFSLGRRAKIHSFVAIETGSVAIGDDSSIMEQVVVGGMLTPRSALTVGKRVKVFPYSFLNPTEPIFVGDDAGIGGANYIFTHGSWQSMLEGYPVAFGPVTIQRGVWLPWRVFILPNVTIGEYATIGAGSVINRDIAPHSLAAGSPAKVVRTREQYVKDVSPEERHAICLRIIQEMVEYLQYRGLTATSEAGTEGISACVVFPKIGEVRLRYERVATASGADVYVSLGALDSAVRQNIANREGAWFDIERKECWLSSSPLCLEVRNFFGRYGVRFDALN
jgi:acetyltransferase-like isoleucine patch superfamily enzyme